ncbi:hypothetical protein LCGC14_1613220 [marine sediment metagenome]|uniref:Uncharacterized protein n=1 Tax=marine sediment metagenome TaxID=412755 RepID=A0A0F9I7Y5_9ZZZZ
MRQIHTHQDRELIYCHAEEEIPKKYWWDFQDWMEDNCYNPLIIKGFSKLVYRPHHVKEYLQMMGIPCVEIIEDQGHVLREIVRGESKLEIMD